MSVNNSIFTNTAAFTALQNLNQINRTLEAAQARVSSGLRVSSALDDTAAFSIAQGIRGEIKAIDTVRQGLTKVQGIIDYTLAAVSGISSLTGEIKAKLTTLTDTSLSAAQRVQANADFNELISQAAAFQSGAARLDEVNGRVVDLFSASGQVTNASIVVNLNPSFTGSTPALAASTITISSAATINIHQRLQTSLAIATTYNAAANAQSTLATSFVNFEAAVNLALGQLTSKTQQISQHLLFLEKVKGTRQELLGSYVDADLAAESAKLTALQVQQQLAVQAVGIANQRPQSLLGLFR
jgi:flagellin